MSVNKKVGDIGSWQHTSHMKELQTAADLIASSIVCGLCQVVFSVTEAY